MKLSIDWLSDFVDLNGIAPEQLAESLTLKTAEVEGWERVTRSLKHVVVARVEEIKPTEDPGLVHARLATGDKVFQTVSRAPNLREGLKVCFAVPGAVLANGTTVTEQSISGHRSQGTICSAGEMGFGAGQDKVLECPLDVEVGSKLEDLVPEQDILIDIDNKSLTHRPDLWGHYGFARELSAVLGRPLRDLPTSNLDEYSSLPAVPVSVENLTDCPCYGAIKFGIAQLQPSSLKVQWRLCVLGHNPLNVLVDLTNYVQFELGQPLHAFDARHIEAIVVANAGAERTFCTLDGNERKLAAEDLLICDRTTPVALAGIMGGESSKVFADTREIVLEAANFRGTRIRLTSARLGLRTDASLRYEKKLPPILTRIAAARFARLMDDNGLNPTAQTRYTVTGDEAGASRTISLAAGYLERISGAPIDDVAASKILGSIGFSCAVTDKGLDVSVPPFRSAADISTVDDVAEEVMRLYGYDNITPVAPLTSAVFAPFNEGLRNQHRIRRVLAQAHGFVEVQTYSWMTDGWLSRIEYAPDNVLHVDNPAGADRAGLRTSLLPNLLQAARQNRKIGDNFAIFEIGRVFSKQGAGTRETDEVAGVIVNQVKKAAVAKTFDRATGALGDVLAAAGLVDFRTVRADPRSPACELPWGTPKATLAVQRGGKVIGHVGLVSTKVTKATVDAGHIVWFQLPLADFPARAYPPGTYVPIPNHPGSSQDFTIKWSVAKGYAQLVDLLDEFNDPALHERELVDYFQKKQDSVGHYTFRFGLRVPERTITSEEIDGFREAILQFFGNNDLEIA